MPLDDNYGIIPPTGALGSSWPSRFTLPQGASGQLSTGGWTLDDILSNNFGNEGFIQQTFLGASIQSFDLTAGFGDTVSSLSLQLVNDEFNKSDLFGYGAGDDPYHNGDRDTFLPPVVGTPVFFKFGKNPATVEQAYRQTFDDLYGIRTLPVKVNSNNAWGWFFPQAPYNPEQFSSLAPYHMVNLERSVIEDRSLLWDNDTAWRGRNHFAFGGILQSYTQNKSNTGSPLYSVTVTDPREILSNVEVLLNNYQGTTFNNKNIINLYGFLEYDPSTSLMQGAELRKRAAGVVEKLVNDFGVVSYLGMLSNWNSSTGWETTNVPADVLTEETRWQKAGLTSYTFPPTSVNLLDQYHFGKVTTSQRQPEFFPITGQGFSRRSDKGMPWYRIGQGLTAMFQYYGGLPQEYIDAGFGGQINFRGYNYVVDFTGIPVEKIPLLYYMDFDKIDLLSLAQELCDIISHELYVTLLPIIDHPACQFLYEYNNEQVKNGAKENIVAGIIRLDAIDKTVQPRYGAIKAYLDNLSSRGIDVENQDIGFELSNVTTDKFVVGAQETDMYFFSTERDRDTLWESTRANIAGNQESLSQIQWDLRTQEQQQVLPYYGLLGDSAVTIPRGFGPYQQILLDATSLNAFGVGNYYVATELELRAATVSYEAWTNFLLSYNDIYVEDIAEHRATISTLSLESDQISRVLNEFQERVGIDGDILDGDDGQQIQNYLDAIRNQQYAVTVPRCAFHSDRPYMTEEGYPASPCSPPFGYPLYYKRATRIGMVQAGMASILNAKIRVVTDTAQLKKDLENNNSPLLSLSYSQLAIRMQRLEDQLAKMRPVNGINDDYKQSPRYKSLMSQMETAKKVFVKWEQLIENVGGQNGSSDLIARIQKIGDADDPDSNEGMMNRFLVGADKTAQKHEENAKRVYDFVKKVADENLGRRFLVRLPKSANLNFDNNIAMFDGDDTFNISRGPFGFPPRPISASFAGQLNDATAERDFLPEDIFSPYLQDYEDPINPDTSVKLPVLERYNSGAMKGNYNPFSEKWEWNYQPNGQGGFFSFDAFGTNISALEYSLGNIPFSSLPLVMQNGLCPIDIANISDENSRIHCYASYHHSELLDFTSIQASDMTQQSTDGFLIPDVAEQLPNNSLESFTFDSIEEYKKQQRLGKTPNDAMAFVKCTVDEKLYLPPKLQTYNLDVWARDYELKLSVPEPDTHESIDVETCERTFSYGWKPPMPIFSVPKDGGRDGTSEAWTDFARYYDPTLDGLIVDSRTRNLDDEHVYVLVTVPGRIKPTLDSRWRDGPLQAYNTIAFKHLMTQDVVQIPAFNKPNFPQLSGVKIPCGAPPIYGTREEALASATTYGLRGVHWRPDEDDIRAAQAADDSSILPPIGHRPGKKSDWTTLSLEQISSARSKAKQVLDSAAAGSQPVSLGFISPSPVFPDIVAIPLMSKERCYGPWLSASQLDSGGDARVKYSNIGGKVEFIKDENLSPWSYAGYQLLDEAGALQANFSNSLLLFSERGGFVMPDAPTGIALATALQRSGPLITSIAISVDANNGVKTTVKLDLYTAQFGKLAKQKEMAISQVARERQKLTDQNNAAIRRGLGKNQTSSDLVSTVMNEGGTQFLQLVNSITNQVETNRELGEDLDEIVMVAGETVATTMFTKSYEKIRSAYSDAKNQNLDAVATLGSLWKSVTQNYDGLSTAQVKAINDRINGQSGE